MYHYKLFYHAEIFRRKVLVYVKAKYFLLETKMQRLGDVARGLEVILQIWRLGGHFWVLRAPLHPLPRHTLVYHIGNSSSKYENKFYIWRKKTKEGGRQFKSIELVFYSNSFIYTPLCCETWRYGFIFHASIKNAIKFYFI